MVSNPDSATLTEILLEIWSSRFSTVTVAFFAVSKWDRVALEVGARLDVMSDAASVAERSARGARDGV